VVVDVVLQVFFGVDLAVGISNGHSYSDLG
jgi:hypothetical protein